MYLLKRMVSLCVYIRIVKTSLNFQIVIHDTTPENFLAFLEYLYTDHSPIEDGDSVGILELSDKYGTPRLMALCELYVSKVVEKATVQSIAEADVDVVGKTVEADYMYRTLDLGVWGELVTSNHKISLTHCPSSQTGHPGVPFILCLYTCCAVRCIYNYSVLGLGFLSSLSL